MLNVIFFTFNAFEENLVINDKKQCWIIDPGMYDQREQAQFISYLDDKQLQPQSIINTHAHIDHIMGVNVLKNKYDIPFGVHEMELPVLQMAKAAAAMFGLDFHDTPTPTFFIKEGVPLQLGDDTLEVFHTPGHSPGSVSFYYPKSHWVISGDVLFSGGIGRTDLPGGNYDILISSIRSKLFTLPEATKVLSGHGPATTIGEEQAHNPFLQ
jgi:hydroxyacylglutathione hydrolase